MSILLALVSYFSYSITCNIYHMISNTAWLHQTSTVHLLQLGRVHALHHVKVARGWSSHIRSCSLIPTAGLCERVPASQRNVL